MKTPNDKIVLASIGRTIKKVRQDKNISQVQLARLAGLQKANLSRIESGKINSTILTLYIIAGALDMKVAQLLAEVSLQALITGEE